MECVGRNGFDSPTARAPASKTDQENQKIEIALSVISLFLMLCMSIIFREYYPVLLSSLPRPPFRPICQIGTASFPFPNPPRPALPAGMLGLTFLNCQPQSPRLV